MSYAFIRIVAIHVKRGDYKHHDFREAKMLHSNKAHMMLGQTTKATDNNGLTPAQMCRVRRGPLYDLHPPPPRRYALAAAGAALTFARFRRRGPAALSKAKPPGL